MQEFTIGSLVKFRADFSPKLIGYTFRVTSEPRPDNTNGGKPYVCIEVADNPKRTRTAYLADLETAS